MSTKTPKKQTDEEWREIKGSQGCLVSNLGNVKNSSGVIIPQSNHQEGYKRINLKIDGKWKRLLVHRLVAEAFCRKIDGKNIVNHKNGKKDDNRASNLEYVTPRENSMLAARNHQLRGCPIGQGGKTKILITNPKGERMYYPSQIQAAEELMLSSAAINKCLKGYTKTVKGYKVEYLNEGHYYRD